MTAQGKQSGYVPPYTVSERAVTLVADIAAAVERYRILLEGPDGVRLRKVNHIRTIRGTTAIEGNTLTEDQITAILAGKRVAAPAREIAEVRGAHAAYALLGKIDPLSMDGILKVHAVMMQGLVQGAGALRTAGVGVVDGLGHVIHMAPPANMVPTLLRDLLSWAKASSAHPLVKSSVFHYEFEFIHPFFDGNGRMGRFLQTAILGTWNPLFLSAPVENMVFENQSGYYDAINVPLDDSTGSRVKSRVKSRVRGRGGNRLKTPDAILQMLRDSPSLTRVGLAEALGLSVKAIEKNLAKLKYDGRLRRVGPDKGGHWEVV